MAGWIVLALTIEDVRVPMAIAALASLGLDFRLRRRLQVVERDRCPDRRLTAMTNPG